MEYYDDGTVEHSPMRVRPPLQQPQEPQQNEDNVGEENEKTDEGNVVGPVLPAAAGQAERDTAPLKPRKKRRPKGVKPRTATAAATAATGGLFGLPLQTAVERYPGKHGVPAVVYRLVSHLRREKGIEPDSWMGVCIAEIGIVQGSEQTRQMEVCHICEAEAYTWPKKGETPEMGCRVYIAFVVVGVCDWLDGRAETGVV